ncbi:MAG: DUF4411 family protein [Rhodospirillaceae bacterium]|nr:DUF4411 family protein [Rhodospirillaceae bacterium]
MYLLDADTLIKAMKTYYQLNRVRQFWEWLAYQAEIGEVRMPIETWVKVGDKTLDQRDNLALWAIEHKDNLVIQDRSYDERFPEVLAMYQWPDGRPMTEANLETIGDDYQLIACAIHNSATVITGEVSAGSIGPNRKVPNVCDDLGIDWTNLDGSVGKPGLVDILDFRTDWNK